MKYELKAVPNVSEVASVGVEAVQRANQESGGSVLELGEAEYMVRAAGYLQSLDDFRKIPLMTTEAGVPVRLGDVARTGSNVSPVTSDGASSSSTSRPHSRRRGGAKIANR